MDVKKGKRYRCIKTVHMVNDPEDIRYIKGKTYRSDVEGAITDETGLKEHYWSDETLIKKYFILSGNKRRSGNSRNN